VHNNSKKNAFGRCLQAPAKAYNKERTSNRSTAPEGISKFSF